MNDDDAVAAAEALVERDVPVQVARSLVAFRGELTVAEVPDEEAYEYTYAYLTHLLSAWVPVKRKGRQ